MSKGQVLVVDDKESVLELMASILSGTYDVTTTSDPAAAMALVGQAQFDVVLTDVRMPGATGFDVLTAALQSSHPASVIMMTGYASVPDAVEAMRKGAFDYVAKPLQADDVSLVVARALEHRARRVEDGSKTSHHPSDFREAMLAARDRASREYLVALMRDFRGNVTRAAKQAGLSREGLHRLLRKYGVRSEDFRTSTT